MEKIDSSERMIPDTDFASLVTEVVDNTKLLAGTGKDNPDYVTLDIGEAEHVVIHIEDIDKKNKSIHKRHKRINFEPQSVRKIEIWYNPLHLDNGELVSTILEFTEEKREERTVTKLTNARTYPSEALANPPRRRPPEGLYPVYDRDTIDWSKMPEHRSIAAEEAIKLLEKIRDRVLSMPR